MRLRVGARTLIIATVVVAIGITAYVVRDFIGEAIVRPAYVQLQLILLYIRSLPQDAIWLALVGIGIYVAYRSLRPRRDRSRKPAFRAGDERPSADRMILRWTIAARRNPYFRERLAELLAQHLCRAVGVSPGRARTAGGLESTLESRGVVVPDYITTYLDDDRSRRLRIGLLAFRRRVLEAEMRRLEDAVIEVERMVGVHERRND